ncbi:hypothetical protein MesoLjLb_30370 [Mesorhizobium sp. L-8-3]|uniref:hypothetical protein n=1 Tax=Mesorhizobium sp. L-8-3 TaxID=2744522 RepID=UPI0019295E04|nr:hypothetical protein [Mesorhizobium sp. L-8-3]BCH23252.1 hypothetical protein MesoLjLb_30370 [Mesorhizobium sp. L-8-3]
MTKTGLAHRIPDSPAPDLALELGDPGVGLRQIAGQFRRRLHRHGIANLEPAGLASGPAVLQPGSAVRPIGSPPVIQQLAHDLQLTRNGGERLTRVQPAQGCFLEGNGKDSLRLLWHGTSSEALSLD